MKLYSVTYQFWQVLYVDLGRGDSRRVAGCASPTLAASDFLVFIIKFKSYVDASFNIGIEAGFQFGTLWFGLFVSIRVSCVLKLAKCTRAVSGC